MKIFLVLVLFVCGAAYADGPIFQHKDTFEQQEFENAYQNIRALSVVTASGTIRCIDLPAFCVDTATNRIGFGTQTPAFSIDVIATSANSILRLNELNGRGALIRFDDNGTARGWVGVEGQYIGTTSPNMALVSQSSTAFYVNGNSFPSGAFTNAGVFVSSAATTSSQMQLFNTGGRGSMIAFAGNNSGNQGFVGMEGVYLGNANQNMTIAGNNNRSVNLYSDGSGTASLIVATGTIGVQIAGTTNGSDARAGDYSEYGSSVTSGQQLAGTSGQYFDVAAVTLQAGDYDLTCVVTFLANGGTVTDNEIGIGTVTGNNSSGLTTGNTTIQLPNATASLSPGGTIPEVRKNPTAQTTYYCKGFAQYTVATPKVLGRLSWRRRR